MQENVTNNQVMDMPEGLLRRPSIAIFDRAKTNSIGFWDRNRWYLIIFTVAILCDAVSTMCFMVQPNGTEFEIHPVIRWAGQNFGPYIGPLMGFFGKVLAALVVAFFIRPWERYLFVTASIISFWACWYNLIGSSLEWYHPNILNWGIW
ncbi:MAG: hypothetical protein JEZ07_04170 [Phycisphaerae bacterium]|nr:hypothetical protein [Phycisphaerae bacterium]